jgi:hypothetical protein
MKLVLEGTFKSTSQVPTYFARSRCIASAICNSSGKLASCSTDTESFGFQFG